MLRWLTNNNGEKKPLLAKTEKSSGVTINILESKESEHEGLKIDGEFRILHNEIVALIISFLTLRELVQVNKTNRKLHEISSQTIAYVEKVDLETGEKKQVPFKMISVGNQQKPATYAQISKILNPKIKRLHNLENDVVDVKIFRSNHNFAWWLPFLFGAAFFMTGMVIALIGEEVGLSHGDMQKTSGCLITFGIFAAFVGSGYCGGIRHYSIKDEKEKLTAEIKSDLPGFRVAYQS